MLETPVFKRPWEGRRGVFGHSALDYGEKVRKACGDWLLDQVEAHLKAQSAHGAVCFSVRELSREFLLAPRFLAVASLYSGQRDPDLAAVLADLCLAEAVPYLDGLRYSEDGLVKRRLWQATWERQRREDQGLVGDPEPGAPPAPPPRYESGDFQSPALWRLRGKLDVPRERFISYPGAEREGDPSPVLGWAGWDALQRASALTNVYYDRKSNEGWRDDRALRLLRGVHELSLWLRLWHGAPHPDYDSQSPAAYFASIIDAESRELGKTPESLPVR